jgi:parallel beta-helix repeat protein
MKYLFIVCSSIFIFGTTVFAAGLIDISYSPYTISQSGSYIVVADLHTPQNVNCITIATSDVTIDLNGHTLYGAGTTAGSTGCGIYASSSNNNIAVKNGVVRDFRDAGLYLEGLNSQVIQIRAYANRLYGIYVNRDGTVTGNSVCSNNEYGIYAFLCCTVTGNSAYQNGTYGISASVSCTVTGNSAYQNGDTGITTSAGCVVTNNSAYENSGRGIATGNSTNVTGNSVYHNSQHGILTGESCTVIGNSAENNLGDGINAGSGSTVKDNTVRNNTGNGILVSSATLVIGNTCSYNGYGTATACGIRTNSGDNSIEHNLLISNDIGLLLTGAYNFYASNRASGNTLSNYSTVGLQYDGGIYYDTALSNASFYYQPNPVIQQIIGFEIPTLREAEATITIRSVRW